MSGESHQAFHDCESVYWLCSIALLRKHSSSKVKKYVERIIDSSQGLDDVEVAKMGFMAYLLWFNKLGAEAWKKIITEQVQPKNTVEKDLFECLIDLTDYFYSQPPALPEQTAGCFKACSDIIGTAVDRTKGKESSRVNEDEEPPKKKAKTVRQSHSRTQQEVLSAMREVGSVYKNLPLSRSPFFHHIYIAKRFGLVLARR